MTHTFENDAATHDCEGCGEPIPNDRIWCADCTPTLVSPSTEVRP